MCAWLCARGCRGTHLLLEVQACLAVAAQARAFVVEQKQEFGLVRETHALHLVGRPALHGHAVRSLTGCACVARDGALCDANVHQRCAYTSPVGKGERKGTRPEQRVELACKVRGRANVDGAGRSDRGTASASTAFAKLCGLHGQFGAAKLLLVQLASGVACAKLALCCAKLRQGWHGRRSVAGCAGRGRSVALQRLERPRVCVRDAVQQAPGLVCLKHGLGKAWVGRCGVRSLLGERQLLFAAQRVGRRLRAQLLRVRSTHGFLRRHCGACRTEQRHDAVVAVGRRHVGLKENLPAWLGWFGRGGAGRSRGRCEDTG